MKRYQIVSSDSEFVSRVIASNKSEAIVEYALLELAGDRGEYQHIINRHLNQMLFDSCTFDAIFLEVWKLGIKITSIYEEEGEVTTTIYEEKGEC